MSQQNPVCPPPALNRVNSIFENSIIHRKHFFFHRLSQGVWNKERREYFDFWMSFTHNKFVENCRSPFVAQKRSFYIFSVHGTRNDRFQFKVSMKRKSVLKIRHWITEILVKMYQNQILFIFTLYFTLFSMNIHIEIKELIENKHSKQMEWCKKSADTFHSIWKIFMNLETFYHVMSIKYWLIFQRQI